MCYANGVVFGVVERMLLIHSVLIRMRGFLRVTIFISILLQSFLHEQTLQY